MDNKTKETLYVVGVAAALGMVAGAIAYQDHKPDREKFKGVGSRDSLSRFLDRLMDTLPHRERDHVMDHGRSRFRDVSDRLSPSDFLEKMVDALPRREAEHLLHRIQSKLKK